MRPFTSKLPHTAATLCFLLFSISATAQPTNEILSGEFVVATYFNDAVDGQSTSLSTITLDGEGGGTWDVMSSSLNDLGSGALTYEVHADATFSMAVEGAPARGVIDQNGAMMAAVELDAEAFGLHIAMKKSSGLTLADLTGDYAMIQYFNDQEDGLSTAFSTLTFDGAGGGTFTVEHHSLGEAGSAPFTYTLAEDGALSILADGSTLQGSYNPALAGLALVELDPEAFGVYIGVQKSTGNSAASLDGSFQVAQYQAASTAAYAGYNSHTWDGSGAGSRLTVQRSDGGDDSGTFSYSVNDDGTFDLTGEGLNKGAVAPDGTWFLQALIEPTQLSIMIGSKKLETVTHAEKTSIVPEGYALSIGPNPSTGPVTVRLKVPNSTPVVLEVYDLLGRRTAVLVDSVLPAGPHLVQWDAGNAAPGSYFFRLKAGPVHIMKQGILY